MSFAKLAALVGGSPRQPDPAAPADADLAAYVNGTLRRLPPPWRYTCLRRGIVMYYLLRHAGRPIGLHIGVRKSAGALQAHAWLVMDGAPYLEPEREEHAAFQVIAAFPQGAPAR